MKALPPLIEPVFQLFENEFVWLTVRWRTYCQLYLKSEKRIELLNVAAGPTFYVLQDVLVSDIQISLSKLTDPARTRQFDNLTIEKMHELVLSGADTTLHVSLEGIIGELRAVCAPLRMHRNKRLAHLDLNVAMDLPESALPGVTREMIETAIALIGRYLNVLNAHYKDSETAFDHTLTGPGDGDQLIECLKQGQRYHELQQADDFDWEDPQRSPWYDA